MPKKITIVSAASLVLLTALVLTVSSCSGSRNERGVPEKVSIYDREAGVIYTPDYEELLCSCVSAMIPSSMKAEPEMLKAAAIAENTRIRFYLGMTGGFDDAMLGAQLTVNEAVNYSPEEPDSAVKSAVSEVLNVYMTYENEPWNVPVCELSTGRTDECPPYSPSLALPCDINARGFESSVEFSPEEVRKALKGGNLTYNFNEWFHDPVYGANGTLLFVDFSGERVTGETLRNALELRSTAITIEYGEDLFTFRCLGKGNNKGMSLNAANCLAKEGKTAQEILEYFFPDAKIVS